MKQVLYLDCHHDFALSCFRSALTYTKLLGAHFIYQHHKNKNWPTATARWYKFVRCVDLLFLTKYYFGNESRRMRWAGHVARMGREREEVHIEFRWENLIKDHLENPGVDGDYENVFSRSGVGGMHWVDVVQDGDRWRAVVNAVMNLPVL
jgi:hypothetical protein